VKIRKCVRCGYIETKVVPPSGHTFGEWIFSGVAASKEKRRICSKCGYTEIVPISDTPDSNKKTSEKFKRNWKKLNIWLFLSLAFLTIGALLSNNTRVLVDGVPLYPFMGKVGGISTLFFEILRIIRISNAKNVDKYILLSCKKTEGFASVASFIVFLLLAATEELYSGSEIYDSIAGLGSFAFVHAVFALICSSVAKSKAKKTQVNSGNKSQNNTASNVSRNTANKSSEYIEFYINTLKNTAAKQGNESITIDSNKVYTVFNAHTEKAIIVASMKKIMRNHDRIIFESPTSIVIQYFVK